MLEEDQKLCGQRGPKEGWSSRRGGIGGRTDKETTETGTRGREFTEVPIVTCGRYTVYEGLDIKIATGAGF